MHINHTYSKHKHIYMKYKFDLVIYIMTHYANIILERNSFNSWNSFNYIKFIYNRLYIKQFFYRSEISLRVWNHHIGIKNSLNYRHFFQFCASVNLINSISLLLLLLYILLFILLYILLYIIIYIIMYKLICKNYKYNNFCMQYIK